jgi:hypothetical protein
MGVSDCPRCAEQELKPLPIPKDIVAVCPDCGLRHSDAVGCARAKQFHEAIADALRVYPGAVISRITVFANEESRLKQQERDNIFLQDDMRIAPIELTMQNRIKE